MRTNTLLWLGVALVSACDDPADPALSQTEQHMTGGSASNCYPQVVILDSGCIGTLIDPTTVLTAAHCVVVGGHAAPPTQAYNDRGLASVTQIYVDPSYNACQPEGPSFANASGRDLAVVKLSRGLLPPGVSGATLASATAPPNTPLTAIGWGEPNNDRRMGGFVARSSSTNGSINIDGVNAGICNGDSGGAFFRSGGCSGSPAPVISAVVSSQPLGVGQNQDCTVGNRTVAANLGDAANRNWINQAKNGQAPPFDPAQHLDCCMPGQTRSCTGGSQTCGSDGRWGGCTSHPQPAICGDHVCAGGESCSTCPTDCGGCCSASSCSAACRAQATCGSCSYYGDWGEVDVSGSCSGSYCYCTPIPGSCRPC